MSDFNSIVLKKSEELPEGVDTEIKGYDFNKGINYDDLFKSYFSCGIQSTNFALAVNIINEMIEKKAQPLPLQQNEDSYTRFSTREKSNCTIFLGYTANMITCGVRENIRYLAQHNLIDVIVTSGGGIEEDFIKCMKPTYVGSFHKFNDVELRKKGINRTGNMLTENQNYVDFEHWFMPIIIQMHKEQNELSINWTPSKIIKRLGKEINHEDSVYYWCYKNNIDVYCPAITDGSIGDMLYFYNIANPGFRVDLVEDIGGINSTAVTAVNTGMIILGGGIIKHHIANANLMRNGADYSVYINTGNYYESSDSGAPPEEAISWGKIKSTSEPVKLFCEASLVFPLIVAQTFAKFVEDKKKIKV